MDINVLSVSVYSWGVDINSFLGYVGIPWAVLALGVIVPFVIKTVKKGW